MKTPITREEWLTELALLMAPILEARTQNPLPPFRVSCSWPSRHGMPTARGYVRGQCWSASASSDGHAEIFITPIEDDPREIAGLLSHELLHAGLPGAGHGKLFQKAALAIGHKGPFRSLNTTPSFWCWVDPLLAFLPEYPHKKIVTNSLRYAAGEDRPEGAPKPQKGRQMKLACESCGCIVRMSRKAIETPGAPSCACGAGPMTPQD